MRCGSEAQRGQDLGGHQSSERFRGLFASLTPLDAARRRGGRERRDAGFPDVDRGRCRRGRRIGRHDRMASALGESFGQFCFDSQHVHRAMNRTYRVSPATTPMRSALRNPKRFRKREQEARGQDALERGHHCCLRPPNPVGEPTSSWKLWDQGNSARGAGLDHGRVYFLV